MPVSPCFHLYIYFALCYLMAAAGQTFVLQMHGAGWGEEAGLCVNARSEATNEACKEGKKTVLLRSHHMTKRKCHDPNRPITHLLTHTVLTCGGIFVRMLANGGNFKRCREHTWVDYREGPCGSRRPPPASSAWRAASATHTSWTSAAAPPGRLQELREAQIEAIKTLPDNHFFPTSPQS